MMKKMKIPLKRQLKPMKSQRMLKKRKQKGSKMFFCLPAGRKEASRTKKQRKLTKKRKQQRFASITGRCNFGMSGKMKVDGEWKKCPFAHPRVCEKLLSNGERGKFGCKGDCKKLHPKMCYSSLNKKKCPHDKQCRNRYIPALRLVCQRRMSLFSIWVRK